MSLRDLLPAMSVPLPPGRAVRGDEGFDEDPALWMSDAPVTAELWRSVRAEQQRSGLCPLVLDGRRPWDDGELWPAAMTSPDRHDAGDLLAKWWKGYTAVDDGDMLSPAERLAVTDPFGQSWPGLAGGKPLPVDPGVQADRCVEQLLVAKPESRLGLVPATRSSDAPAAAGWQGAVNYTNDTAQLSAVLRSWEDRFGVRVIAAGSAELFLSVAAPPADPAEALRMAAEHFAFCPDNVWQGSGSLAGYARHLVGAPLWSFWWD